MTSEKVPVGSSIKTTNVKVPAHHELRLITINL
jgi:hypothetical protein